MIIDQMLVQYSWKQNISTISETMPIVKILLVRLPDKFKEKEVLKAIQIHV
jgi:hypothetical protein